MTPLERLRVEKAAADCGFEMSLQMVDGCLQLRSAHFPEYVLVSVDPKDGISLTASNPLLLDTSQHTAVVYGYPALYEILSQASARARTLPNRIAEAFRREIVLLPRATEAERLVIQRVGQDLFRAGLLDYWQGHCCVTGLAVAGLLRASHMKPWADCASDDERLDVFNGLLLAPHLDALFDGGWITFDDSGMVVVSTALPRDAAQSLGVTTSWKIHVLVARHLGYLAYHRQHVFRKSAE